MKSIFSFRKVQLITALFLCSVLILSATGTAHAMEFIPGDHLPAGQTIEDDAIMSGEDVVIDGTVNGTLIATGNTVTINGEVNGDVIAMGSLVTINGKVTGNVFAGAHTVQANGEVSGSVFGGAASLVLGADASVGRNVYYGGYSLATEAGSTIQRDLAVGAYQALLKGNIERDAHVDSAALELDGTVGRNLIANVEAPSSTAYSPTMFIPQPPNVPAMPATVATGMRIGTDASIGGQLTYTSSVPQASAIQATPMGGVVYQTPVPQAETTNQPAFERTVKVETGFWGWFFKFLREIVTLMAFGSLAIWLIYPLFKRTSNMIAAKPLPSLGVGFIVALVGYVGLLMVAGALLAVVILFAILTLGGISSTLFGVGFAALGLIAAVFTFLVNYGAKLVFALLVGQWLLHSLSPNAPENKFGALALGVVVYALAHAVPFVGGLVAFVVTLFGLGAMWYAFQASRKGTAPVELPTAQE